MKLKKRKALKIISAVCFIAFWVLMIYLVQRLLMPKYQSGVVEGSMIEQYYDDGTKHDVIMVGDCEVYENISPVKKTSLLFEPIEREAEPTIKEVRLQGFDTPENRKVLVTLSNGTEVTIAPCHGGFHQYGCTWAESQVTIDIALKFAKWLNGNNL